MKKLLALLLALAMVFSLAACASSGKDADDDGRDTPEESAAPAPDAAEDDAQTDDSLRAFAERYDDMGNALPEFDTAGLLAAIAPHLEHEALAEALQLVYKVGIFTEEQFFDALDYAKPRETLLKTYGGDYRIETTMTEAEPLDEARMDEILDLLAAELDDYTRRTHRRTGAPADRAVPHHPRFSGGLRDHGGIRRDALERDLRQPL